MSKMQKMSDADIQKAIETFNKKLPLIPEGEDRDLCLVGLENFQNELQRRAQKKSVEPSANQGQSEQPERRLPTKEELQAWERGMEKSAQNQQRDQAEGAQAFEREQRVIGTVTEAPVITVPVVQIALSSGTKQMNRVEIMNMLKTWFKRVATSKAMEKGLFSDAYGGAMGQDTYKLFQGWNTIYNETQEGAAWPPLDDVFPGLGRASQSQKVNAEILWRWASNDK